MDHMKIAKYVKDTLMMYYGEGVDAFADYLLEPPEKEMEEMLGRTGGWGSSCAIVQANLLDGVVGDEFRFTTHYDELDEEGAPIEGGSHTINITFRLVSIELKDNSHEVGD